MLKQTDRYRYGWRIRKKNRNSSFGISILNCSKGPSINDVLNLGGMGVKESVTNIDIVGIKVFIRITQ